MKLSQTRGCNRLRSFDAVTIMICICIRSATAAAFHYYRPNLPNLLPCRTAVQNNGFASYCTLPYVTVLNNSRDRNSETENSNESPIRKARLVFLGTPDVAASSLQSLVKASQEAEACFDIVGVVTQPPKRRKRNAAAEPSPVQKVAEDYGIHVLSPEQAKDPEFLEELENTFQPDICITAAYGQYLPKRFLAVPKLGTINIHPSLLPRWRGASPVQRSLEAGDDIIGVSILYTVSKMDAGPIIFQDTYKVGINEQSKAVLQKLFEVGTESLIKLLPSVVSGKITFDTATPQNEDGVVKADMIDVAEGELKVWKESAAVAHNKVRGFSIWPGTWIYFNIGIDSQEPVRIKVIQTKVREEKLAPTRTVELGKNRGDGLLVICADGSVLELLQVQPETKKVMDAKSFVNGLRDKTLEWVEMP